MLVHMLGLLVVFVCRIEEIIEFIEEFIESGGSRPIDC